MGVSATIVQYSTGRRDFQMLQTLEKGQVKPWQQIKVARDPRCAMQAAHAETR